MVHIKEGNGASIKNNDLFNTLSSSRPVKPLSKDSKDKLFNYILETLEVSELRTTTKDSLQNIIKTFTVATSRFWQKCSRNVIRFRNQNKIWLEQIVITSGGQESAPSTSTCREIGRPKKSFCDLFATTKRRRLSKEVKSKSKEELCLAASMKLHSEGNRSAASLVLDISTSPKKAQINKELSNWQDNSMTYSCQEALSLFTDLKLTRHQYIALRASAIRKNLKNLFPPYYKIIEEKQKCYPKNITVTEKSAEVPLQDLIDHTVSRILTHQTEVLKCDDSSLEITFKWGADGSGSQKNYKQAFQSADSDDSYLFMSSLVPIQLRSINNREKIYWQNPRPNSVRYCRPIRMQLVKETDTVIKDKFAYIDRQIENLISTKVELNGFIFNVHHSLVKTMVDGKVCNTLCLNRSTQKCYICNASSSQFNDIEAVQSRSYNPESLSFGLSPLHAYIRFYECMLHISYKLPILNKQARGEENKRIVADRKKHIQKEFRDKLGLLVDIPKPGFGNTNDGNTARRFFENPVITSNITGIDKSLIKRFSVILKTLNCPYKINSDKFGKFAKETAALYVELYSWYSMTPTVHKVLIHGKDIIDHFLLPIGMLGEDAQESRHKDVRYYREHNTRKMTRKETNEDLMKILLVSSDPIISNIRILPVKHKHKMPIEVLNLLQEPEVVCDEE